MDRRASFAHNFLATFFLEATRTEKKNINNGLCWSFQFITPQKNLLPVPLYLPPLKFTVKVNIMLPLRTSLVSSANLELGLIWFKSITGSISVALGGSFPIESVIEGLDGPVYCGSEKKKLNFH